MEIWCGGKPGYGTEVDSLRESGVVVSQAMVQKWIPYGNLDCL